MPCGSPKSDQIVRSEHGIEISIVIEVIDASVDGAKLEALKGFWSTVEFTDNIDVIEWLRGR
jgi:hypothetical protein